MNYVCHIANSFTGSRPSKIIGFESQNVFKEVNIIKGLVAVCYSFCIYFSLYNTVDTSYNHTSFIHKHSLRPISISSQLSAQWAEPPWGADPRFELTASQLATN